MYNYVVEARVVGRGWVTRQYAWSRRRALLAAMALRDATDSDSRVRDLAAPCVADGFDTCYECRAR